MPSTQLQPSTLRVGKRYRATRVDESYDAIVIGSGIGGLASAAMMSKAGKKVLVLEQHYTAGGYTHSYSRNGYEWDVGVHYIGEVGNPNSSMRKLFDFISDEGIRWAKLDDNYDRFHFGDDVYNLRAGRENFIADLETHFPKEKKAIQKYIKLLDRVNLLMPALVADKLLPDTAGMLYNAFKAPLLPSFMKQTTYQVLSKLTKNEKLIGVLTGQWGDCGLPPKESSFVIHALIARHYLEGAYYPEGGAWTIAEAIIPVIQASGGDVLTYAKVDEIIFDSNAVSGVRMADGHTIHAKQVISGAGVFNTFNKLVPKNIVEKSIYAKTIDRVQSSKAHLGLYIGLKGSVEELKLPKTNFWIFPDYDATKASDAFENDMNEEFSAVYISFPSAKDPAWKRKNPDKCTIEIVAPCPYSWFERWKDEPWGKRGEEYDELKTFFEERLLEKLYEKMPHLRGKLDYVETSTPLSTEFFCEYGRGELYGLNHDPNRFSQTWLKPKTQIKGLYLTGQDVLTCGVGGALVAGMMAAVSALGLDSRELIKHLGARDSAKIAVPAFENFL